MDSFGTDLYRMFLTVAWRNPDPTRLEFATWEDVAKMFFDSAAGIRDNVVVEGIPWKKRGIEELDIALMQMAEVGQFSGQFTVGPYAGAELWRRWQYAIIGARMEADAGNELNLPVPLDAPDDLKGWALVLYVLGGPARDYDPKMFR